MTCSCVIPLGTQITCFPPTNFTMRQAAYVDSFCWAAVEHHPTDNGADSAPLHLHKVMYIGLLYIQCTWSWHEQQCHFKIGSLLLVFVLYSVFVFSSFLISFCWSRSSCIFLLSSGVSRLPLRYPLTSVLSWRNLTVATTVPSAWPRASRSNKTKTLQKTHTGVVQWTFSKLQLLPEVYISSCDKYSFWFSRGWYLQRAASKTA